MSPYGSSDGCIRKEPPVSRRSKAATILGLGVATLSLLLVAGDCQTAPSTPESAQTERVVVVYVTATPTRTPTPVIHTVQAGDNLSAIADRFGVELDALMAANGIDDPNLITVGAVLEIPRRGVSVVEVTATPLPPTPTPSVNPVSINPTSTGIENLPETLPHNVTLYTEGPSTELPCFASVTVGEPPYQDRVERYQTFTKAGSYRITATVGGKKVWEFSTQYCKPWSINVVARDANEESAVVQAPTPAPTATPRPTRTPTPVIHTVQAGDNLSAIADRFGVELDALIAANGIDDPNLITVGAVLEIPRRGVSVVEVTATPLPATPTLVPTATPQPACPDPKQAAAYFGQLGIPIYRASRSFTNLGELFGLVSQQPALLSDQGWIIKVATEVVDLSLAADEIELLKAPVGVEELDNLVRRLPALFRSLEADVSQLLDYGDVEAGNRIARTMAEVNEIIVQSNLLLDSFC